MSNTTSTPSAMKASEDRVRTIFPAGRREFFRKRRLLRPRCREKGNFRRDGGYG